MSGSGIPPWAMPYWLTAGVLVGVGVAGILTIGLPLLVVGAVLVGIGLSRPTLCNRSVLAALVGLMLVAAWVALVSIGGGPATGSSSSSAR